MNKLEVLKAIYELPKMETNIPISAMNSINVDDLVSAIDRLDKTPTYKDLLKENKQLQQELNQKNKIIEEIKTLIENYKDLCNAKGLNMHLTICMIEDILITKGSEDNE